MKINKEQLELVNKQIDALTTSLSFYGKKLKEAGILSEEEFQAQKSKLLGM